MLLIQTRSTGVIWELVRKAESQACPDRLNQFCRHSGVWEALVWNTGSQPVLHTRNFLKKRETDGRARSQTKGIRSCRSGTQACLCCWGLSFVCLFYWEFPRWFRIAARVENHTGILPVCLREGETDTSRREVGLPSENTSAVRPRAPDPGLLIQDSWGLSLPPALRLISSHHQASPSWVLTPANRDPAAFPSFKQRIPC